MSLTSFLSIQLTEMNGKMISGKPLYVAFAQRKEDRKAMLQVYIPQTSRVCIMLILNVKLGRQCLQLVQVFTVD
jgi:hypothetical protein